MILMPGLPISVGGDFYTNIHPIKAQEPHSVEGKYTVLYEHEKW